MGLDPTVWFRNFGLGLGFIRFRAWFTYSFRAGRNSLTPEHQSVKANP